MTVHATRPAIAQIEDQVRDIPGWTPIDELYSLFSLVLATRDVPGDIVEIGSWCGRSACVLAQASRLAGQPVVHCVDLFPERGDWFENPDGSYSMQVSINGRTYGGYQDQTVWREPFLKDIAPLYESHAGVFEIFQDSIRRAGVEDLIRSHRGDARDFFNKLGPDFRCRLAFLDGDHGYEAVCNDIRLVDRHLSPGGWVCFDDAFSTYDGVDQAIRDLILSNPDYEIRQQMTRKFFVARKRLAALPC